MYRRALELNPNYATAYYWYGYLLRESLGRYEEALALHRKAAELDPLSAGIILEVGADLESLGRFDEALARYQRAIEVDPGYAAAYNYIGDGIIGRSQENSMKPWFGMRRASPSILAIPKDPLG